MRDRYTETQAREELEEGSPREALTTMSPEFG
jgi:hypothetical protein